MITGGKGESRGIGKGELLLEKNVAEKCILGFVFVHLKIDTSHVYALKNYGKGGKGNQKRGGGEKYFFPIFS